MSLFDLNVSSAISSLPCKSPFSNPRIDNAGVYHGAPVAVQLLGRRLDEERVLTLAEHIYEALSK